MITVVAEKKDGGYCSFCSSGHAGSGPGGFDIVCAAVSALVITTANSLEAFTDDSFETECRDGYVRLSFPDPLSREACLLLDSLMLGLSSIEQEYGSKYIKVKVREV
ncbi:MAG: ribosomal-processing cysteine protease Prp [Blautia sp.]|nr:ribosomal-processing cysteine protease Prp [Blautia sp.]